MKTSHKDKIVVVDDTAFDLPVFPAVAADGVAKTKMKLVHETS